MLNKLRRTFDRDQLSTNFDPCSSFLSTTFNHFRPFSTFFDHERQMLDKLRPMPDNFRTTWDQFLPIQRAELFSMLFESGRVKTNCLPFVDQFEKLRRITTTFDQYPPSPIQKADLFPTCVESELSKTNCRPIVDELQPLWTNSSRSKKPNYSQCDSNLDA